MSRRAARCTQAEVTRLIRGAQAAGLPVCGVRLDGGGVTILTSQTDVAAERDLGADAAAIDKALGISGDGQSARPILSR